MEKSLTSKEEVKRYLDSYSGRLFQAIETLSIESLTKAVEILNDARKRASRIFICGNGGSAASADHWATDLSHQAEQSKRFAAISLSSNPSLLTSTGNDQAFDQIFARELRTLGARGDVVILISASGNSKNLLEAAKVASDKGIKTIAVTGFDGGSLAEMADVSLHFATAQGDYGVAEDCHIVLNHVLKEVLV